MCGFSTSKLRRDNINRISTMRLTVEKLRARGAKCSGVEWFAKTFPHGSDISSALAACTNPKWIRWVLDEFGRPR